GIVEAHEANNVSAAEPIAVTRTLADLQISSVSAPLAGTARDSVTIAWHVDNSGAGATNATSWYDNVYLSPTPTLSGASVQIGQVRHVNALASGAGYDASGNFVLPANLTAGSYYFIVKTDGDNAVLEERDDNNIQASAAFSLAALPGGGEPATKPDLAVSNVVAPSDTISGQTFAVSWTLTNQGDAATSHNWYDAVYLSRDQVFDRS